MTNWEKVSEYLIWMEIKSVVPIQPLRVNLKTLKVVSTGFSCTLLDLVRCWRPMPGTLRSWRYDSRCQDAFPCRS